jgi:hypothetical protein
MRWITAVCRSTFEYVACWMLGRTARRVWRRGNMVEALFRDGADVWWVYDPSVETTYGRRVELVYQYGNRSVHLKSGTIILMHPDTLRRWFLAPGPCDPMSVRVIWRVGRKHCLHEPESCREYGCLSCGHGESW